MRKDVNKCPIFVSSADSYADLWPTFFGIFRREWPEYKGTIYLNTELLEFSFDGLNIVCTKVGKANAFGDMFLSGISKIPHEHFLLLMIDYFFEDKVDVPLLESIYDDFLTDGPEAIQLMPHPYLHLKPTGACGHCFRILPPGGQRCAWFSFQAAFWRKNKIARFVKRWESPWTAEFFGTKRAEIFNPNIWVVDVLPIKYAASGIVYGGGKWARRALEKISFDGVAPLDYGKRIYYSSSRIRKIVQRLKRLCHVSVCRSIMDLFISRLRRI